MLAILLSYQNDATNAKLLKMKQSRWLTSATRLTLTGRSIFFYDGSEFSIHSQKQQKYGELTSAAGTRYTFVLTNS
jgi:hypothetical protein